MIHGQPPATTQLTPYAIAQLNSRAEMAIKAFPPNSLAAYSKCWSNWASFCDHQGYPRLPTTAERIDQFFDHAIERGWKRATIELHLSTLALAHRAAALPNPLDTFEGELILRAMRRNPAIPAAQRQAGGLTWDLLSRILSVLDLGRLIELRNAALVSTGYDMMARPSELTALQWGDLTQEPDGSGRMLLGRSKTDQEGRGHVSYLAPDTMDLLRRWQDETSLRDGAVFRSVPRSNQLNRFASSLSVRDVSRIVKACVSRIDLDCANYSGHSMRVGQAQDILAAGMSMPEIMQAGRWKSPAMPMRYTAHLQAGRGASATLARRQGRTGG